ncbi:hypothetical protein BVX97_02680 [bacterium E08(2017)]|nr:hypothetical protein BVX97_02680 [bacterium E08(2017)]
MQLVDSAGSVQASYEYDAFGNIVASSGIMAYANPFRFSTKYYDEETKLSYYGFRYYDAGMGRWLNRDPIGEKGGLNLYGMVNNNPIVWTDDKGKQINTVCNVTMDLAKRERVGDAYAAEDTRFVTMVWDMRIIPIPVITPKGGDTVDVPSDGWWQFEPDSTDWLGGRRCYTKWRCGQKCQRTYCGKRCGKPWWEHWDSDRLEGTVRGIIGHWECIIPQAVVEAKKAACKLEGETYDKCEG